MPQLTQALQEVWSLKLNDAANQRALWLRFSVLISANGFQRVAEVRGLFFQRTASHELTKLALKQTFDLKSFSALPDGGIRIGDCELDLKHTRGQIQFQGKTISWNLKLTPAEGSLKQAPLQMVPETLQRLGIVKSSSMTLAEDLRCSGETVIEGEKLTWNAATGMQRHFKGPCLPDSWIWGHCNHFVDEQGKKASFVFEGLSTQGKLLGAIPSPHFSTFRFLYQGKAYTFNSLWDSIRVKSRYSLTGWKLQADSGELSFHAQAKAELKDFVGLGLEDTNGSLAYCANSALSNLQIHIYRRGKLENAFYSRGTTALEIVSRRKNPYVAVAL